MARQIIILDQIGLPSDLNYNVAFWYAVPAARQPFYANASATTRVIGATAPELAAIVAGQVHEVVQPFYFPINTPLATIQTALATAYTALGTQLLAANRFNHYGTNFDGSVWTMVVVA